MKQNPLKSRTNLSTFVGLWLGLTAMVGLCAFAVLFYALGGYRDSGLAVTATPSPMVAVAATATEAPQVVAPVGETPTPAEVGGGDGPPCALRSEPASGFGYGIQSHVFVGDNDYWLGVISDQLGFGWVKMQVRWYDMEVAPGEIFWDVLDGAVNDACAKGLRVMLSVVASPDWTRANPLPADQGQEAPPDDVETYANFLGQLIDRYPDRIGAIEIWNEMNLEREWNTAAGVNPAEYLALLRAAHNTVRAKDPSIIIISGALSPTGINCNVSFPNCEPSGRPIVMDDVTYLGQFVALGGLDYVDCIGTHSNGTNLPPTADGANPPDRAGRAFGGPWDSPHYSWALKSQVETYAALLPAGMLQCVTEFGYASALDGQFPPNFAFAADIDEQQQAEYLIEAFSWMRESGLVKLAFLFNLDYGPKGGDPASDDNVIFSVLNRQGVPRPAFDALSAMPKP